VAERALYDITSPLAFDMVVAQAAVLQLHLSPAPTYTHLLDALLSSDYGGRLPMDLAEKVVLEGVPECHMAQVLIQPALQSMLNTGQELSPGSGCLGTISANDVLSPILKDALAAMDRFVIELSNPGRAGNQRRRSRALEGI
jgi:hypothetical protein